MKKTLRSWLSKTITTTGLRKAPLSPSTWNNLKTMLVKPPLLRVEEMQGEFYVDPRSDTFLRLITNGFYEPDIVALIQEHTAAQMDAIDIGANVGFFTNLLSKCCYKGRVLACEPTCTALKLLKMNIEHNNLHNVILYEGAVSDRNGEIAFSFVDGKEEYSSIGRIDHRMVANRERNQVIVPTITLDSLVAAYQLHPKIIKIDVEGAEKLVLDGSMETLRKYRPVILSELSEDLLSGKGTCKQAVVGLLRSESYKVIVPNNSRADPSRSEFHEIIAIPLGL